MKTQNQISTESNWIIIKLILLILFLLPAGRSWSQSDQSPTQTVCPGNEPYLVSSTPGSTYTWSITPGTSGTEWRINGTGNSISVDWNIRGAYTLSVIETNSDGCSGLPVSVVVTVNPTPDVDDPSDQTAWNGSATSAVNFTGSIPGTVYNWINDTPSIGLASSGSGNISSFSAVNTGSTPVVATITVTPVYTNAGRSCTGATQSFTITVNPSTSMDPVADASYCNGSVTIPVIFTSPVAGTTFSWTNSNTSIGLGASGTGNLPAFTGTNTGTTPAMATITVTPSVNGVPGTPLTFRITVNPLVVTSPIFHN